jgi:DNA repair protein RadC
LKARRTRLFEIWRAATAIIDIATPLGIAVHDHIIVGRNGHASL